MNPRDSRELTNAVAQLIDQATLWRGRSFANTGCPFKLLSADDDSLNLNLLIVVIPTDRCRAAVSDYCCYGFTRRMFL